MKEKKVVILSSAKLNDNTILEEYFEDIKVFLDTNLPVNYVITIGVIKNVNLINFLQEKGYKINRKNQRLGSLENSNKKLIRDNQVVLFLRYIKNIKIDEFIEYGKKLDHKEIKILNLKEDV